MSVKYDIFNEDNYPHYIEIYIGNNTDINVTITVKNILTTSNYKVEKNLEGIDKFLVNDLFKEKLKLIFTNCISHIQDDRKTKIREQISPILPYLYE